MKNVVKPDPYCGPEELNQALKSFVPSYNHQRYHESLDNVTPAGVYFGRREQILNRPEKIKQQTLQQRRRRYLPEKQSFIRFPGSTKNKIANLNQQKPLLTTTTLRPTSFDVIQCSRF